MTSHELPSQEPVHEVIQSESILKDAADAVDLTQKKLDHLEKSQQNVLIQPGDTSEATETDALLGDTTVTTNIHPNAGLNTDSLELTEHSLESNVDSLELSKHTIESFKSMKYKELFNVIKENSYISIEIQKEFEKQKAIENPTLDETNTLRNFIIQLYEAREQRAKNLQDNAKQSDTYTNSTPAEQTQHDEAIANTSKAVEQQESELYGIGATTKAGPGANATPAEKQQHRTEGKQKIKAKIYDQMAKNNPNHTTPDWVVDNMAESIIADENGQKTVDAHTKTFALIQSGHMQEAAAILNLIEQKDFSTVHAMFSEVAAMEPNNQLLQSVLNESNRTIYNVDYAKATLSLHTSVPLSNAGRELIGKAVSNPAQFAVLEQGLASGGNLVETSEGVQMQYDQVTITFTNVGLRIGNTMLTNPTAGAIDDAFVRTLSSEKQYGEYFQQGEQYKQVVERVFGLHLQDSTTLTPRELERFRLLSICLGLDGSTVESKQNLTALGVVDDQGAFREDSAKILQRVLYTLTRFEPSKLKNLNFATIVQSIQQATAETL